MSPPKSTPKLLVTVNSTGRQAASVARAAAAVGYNVRAQVFHGDDVVAEELEGLPNVTVLQGSLEDAALLARLFDGADVAFINTTHWGDEVAIGKAIADAALAANVKHYVYSSMPDHSSFGRGWRALPLWSHKYEIEKYVRTLKGLPSTFVYCGCYNNNFTTLRYPLFGLEFQQDGSLVWQAPFHPDDPIPWLDPEHDMGPALLQIFKEGPARWSGHRIPFTFEVMTPRQACEAFGRGLGRVVHYRRGPIQFHVKTPQKYREHLEILQEVLGEQRAPYYGPDMYYPHEAIKLWEGNRGLEEYAREVFPDEESANGLTWMDEDHSDEEGGGGGSTEDHSVRSVEELRAEDEMNGQANC